MYKDGKPVEFERLTFIRATTIGEGGAVKIMAEAADDRLHILIPSLFKALNLIYELPPARRPACWDEALDSLPEDLRQHVGVCTHHMANTTLFDRRTGATLYYIEECRHTADVVEDDGEIYSRKGDLIDHVTRLFVGCEELEVQIEDFEPYT